MNTSILRLLKCSHVQASHVGRTLSLTFAMIVMQSVTTLVMILSSALALWSHDSCDAILGSIATVWPFHYYCHVAQVMAY